MPSKLMSLLEIKLLLQVFHYSAIRLLNGQTNHLKLPLLFKLLIIFFYFFI